MDNFKPQNGGKSIHRALSVLRAVSKYGDKGARLTKIAGKVKLHVATVHRILLVLNTEGFVNFDPVSKLYHIGPEIYSLQTVPNYYLIRDSYRLALEQIAMKTGDTAYLVIRSWYDTVCIDRVEGYHSIRILYDIGQRLPIGIGASGIAILAFLPSKEIKSILTVNKRRYNQYRKMDVKKTESLVSLARNLGYSLSESTYQKNVNGVGLPIYNKKKEVIGAISVAAISERLNRNRSEEVAKIMEAEISLVQA